MPIIQLHHPADALDAASKQALAGALTEVLLDMEGGAATTGGRGFATVIFQPVASGDWWVGGHTDDTYVTRAGRFLARVTVPEGYMDQTHKTGVHRQVTRAITEVLDPDGATPATSIQVIIDEVTEGNWGAGGQTISLAHIADVVGLPKDGERWAWVESYFAAKARQRAQADFPAGAGGGLTDSVPAIAVP